MSSDPKYFEDSEEPSKDSLEGILLRMLLREFLISENYRKEALERDNGTD